MAPRENRFFRARPRHLLLLASLLLVACGKKGPLYLPDETVAPAQRVEQPENPSAPPAKE